MSQNTMSRTNMDSTLVSSALFLFISLAVIDQNNASCAFPNRLLGRWLWDWTQVQGIPGNQARFVEITSAGYERTIRTVKDPDLSVECDDLKESQDGHVVFAGTKSDQNNTGTCIQVYNNDYLALWKQTPFIEKVVPYTADECESMLQNVPWRYMRKYPLSFGTSRCPFPSSTYQTEYSGGLNMIDQCRGDLTSVTAVKDTYMEIRSCASNASTYDQPYNGRLECVDNWSADVLKANPVDGNYVVLSFLDLDKEQIYSFYCGRYRIDQATAAIHISMYKASPFYTICETHTNADYVSDEDVNIVLRSTICAAERPCMNGGTCKDLLGSYICFCAQGYTGKDCDTEIDFCTPNPCVNNGVCINSPAGFHCDCPGGFGGLQCEDPDHCYGMECHNGGTCTETPDKTSYMCKCLLGFGGVHCQTDIDYCSGVICQNGGVCKEEPPVAKCLCPTPFEGTYCEIFDPCTPSPCHNDAPCITLVDEKEYRCDCALGFRGKNCQESAPCDLTPCLNSGTCRELGLGEFACICSDQWMGDLCHKSNFCSSEPCRNGGACVNKPSGYRCVCPSGYNGTSCEEPVAEAATLDTQVEMYRIIVVIVAIVGAMLIGTVLVIVIACIARRMRRKQEKYNDKLSEVRTLTRGSKNSQAGSLASDRGSSWYPAYKNHDGMSGSMKRTPQEGVNPAEL